MAYSIPIEDEFQDVLNKAMRGLGVTKQSLAEAAGISTDKVEQLLRGDVEPAAIAAVAPVLHLGGEALLALAVKDESVAEPRFPEGLFRANSPYGDMMVNAYLVYDSASSRAVVFDSGADASDLLATIKSKGLKVEHILLTHTHGDHIFDLDRLTESTGAPVLAPKAEPLKGAGSIEPGTVLEVGALRIEARQTTGHSPGGTTYAVQGLAVPVAIVGDAMFARSMGGPQVSYEACLKENRESILSLATETILCPGHGPLTTVGTEKEWNPFFSG